MKTILLAGVAMALVAPASADSYFFRTKPEVSRPVSFSLGSASNQNPGDMATSVIARIEGYDGKAASVSGDAGAAYQICASADCSDQGANWKTAPTTSIKNDAYARVRVTVGAFGSARSATLSVGGGSSTFTATARAKDTLPDAIAAFTNVASATASADVVSDARQLRNHDGAQVSVSGTSAQYRICTTSACTSATAWQTGASEAGKDSWVQLKLTASATASERRDAVLSYGGLTTTWSVTAAPAGTGTYSISTMGINNASLRAALIGALGDGRDWVPCKGSGAVESCSGAKGILITHRSSDGAEFGSYVTGDLSTYGNGGWWTIPGFHYTSVRNGPYLFDSTGSATASGSVDYVLSGGGWHFIPLYSADTTSPAGYSANYYNTAGWRTGWTLTGAGNGQPVSSVFTAYKRK